MNGWKITAKSDSGQCEHCGRALNFMWTIKHDDGRTMGVGRACIKKVTGWSVSAQEAENAIKVAKMDATWEAFTVEHAEVATRIQGAWDAMVAAQRERKARGLDPYGVPDNGVSEYRYAARTGNWDFARTYAA